MNTQKPTIITISGKSYHGKDYVAEILKEHLTNNGETVLIAHNADLLKYICQTYLDWNGEKDEYGRTLLQKVGTEVFRAIDPDIWVNFLKTIVRAFPTRWSYIVIPDARFTNEIFNWYDITDKIHLVRVVRPDLDSQLTEEQQLHPSETSLDAMDMDEIINSGNADELKKAAIQWLEKRVSNGI